MAGKKRNGSVLLTYRHTGQDPIVGLMKKLRSSSKMTDSEISKLTGISTSTPKAWFSKKTRRPKHATLAAYAGAFGKRFVLEDSNDTDPIIRNRK